MSDDAILCITLAAIAFGYLALFFPGVTIGDRLGAFGAVVTVAALASAVAWL